MRVMCVVRKHFYGDRAAIEPMHVYWTQTLRDLGHDVDVFDHYLSSAELGRDAATAAMLRQIRAVDPHVVLYQTAGGREPVDTAALTPVSAERCVIAWNSDDDWAWSHTSSLRDHFTWMVTTSAPTYAANKGQMPQLLKSQWACYPGLGTRPDQKDLGFSFAGQIYGPRVEACRELGTRAGLACFGRGALLVRRRIPYVRGVLRVPLLAGRSLSFEDVHTVWNRSRISYTPLGGSTDIGALQLKGRVFEMGDSGTLMLASRAPGLEEYYEPGVECVIFDDVDECVELARRYIRDEPARARIAEAYARRTAAEHTWHRRMSQLLTEAGAQA